MSAIIEKDVLKIILLRKGSRGTQAGFLFLRGGFCGGVKLFQDMNKTWWISRRRPLCWLLMWLKAKSQRPESTEETKGAISRKTGADVPPGFSHTRRHHFCMLNKHRQALLPAPARFRKVPHPIISANTDMRVQKRQNDDSRQVLGLRSWSWARLTLAWDICLIALSAWPT